MTIDPVCSSLYSNALKETNPQKFIKFSQNPQNIADNWQHLTNQMTDQVAVQQPPSQPKEDKKPATSTKSHNRMNQKSSNKSNSTSQGRRKPSSAGESGSDTGGRKGNDNNGRISDKKVQGNGAKARLLSQGRPSNSNNGQSGNRQASKSSSSTPAPATGAETSDALSSLQRVIADLRTGSPAVQPSVIPQTEVISSLPPNAPVFQPGMQAWPGPTKNIDQARHRKAASVGTYNNNSNIANYAPHLSITLEDEEPGAYDESEIGDANFRQQQNHNRRSLSQSFTAPRFAALAQKDYPEVLGPTGRPQLAPGFMFGGGTRRRGSSNGPMGPPINEEDFSFQFPQQQARPLDSQGLPRQDESGGEITGIMAEQVNHPAGIISYYD